ncbi:hypothetical protein K8O68_01655 [Salipaludibacillus sp. CUR1]|uniref:hypothetical protein n=1 Tax=Salipaludibacillus sp. CUR1 TaxID=2820003 RepID=UPI001E546124|nr:hypothetical protein [Salipaludibacillus sp. CUR1]
MANKDYATHEVLEVHEIMTIKSACAAKSSMMQGLAVDKELKDLLIEDVKLSQKAVEELKGILEESK